MTIVKKVKNIRRKLEDCHNNNKKYDLDDPNTKVCSVC